MAKQAPNEAKENIRVIAGGPIPEVDMSGGAIGARLPVDGGAAIASKQAGGGLSGGPQAVYSSMQNPAPMGVEERPALDRRDPEKEAEAPPVVRLIVANRNGKRVNLASPGNPVGGVPATLPFGKAVDSLNYDFKALRAAGVILVTEEKFSEMTNGLG